MAHKQVSSGSLQVLDRGSLETIGRVEFDLDEFIVEDVDPVVVGDLALITTLRASDIGVRAMRLSTGADEGLVTFNADEFIVRGCDPIVAHGRLVFVLQVGTGTGILRSVELTSPITAGPSDTFDFNEFPQCDVDLVLTLDGTKILYMTYGALGTGNIRVYDAFTLAPITEFPLQANQELPLNGIDPLLTPDGLSALFPMYDAVQIHGRIRFVDLVNLTSVDVSLPAFWPVSRGGVACASSTDES
jgi:hypothetical protein